MRSCAFAVRCGVFAKAASGAADVRGTETVVSPASLNVESAEVAGSSVSVSATTFAAALP
jgi:hypothetical protein